MKKIDLHIHTITTISDSEFIFSLEKLQEYVNTQNIDCIAITNHNKFDLEQFKSISQCLDICIFPGIEINLENGHLLLISDNINLEDFSTKCQRVEDNITIPEDSIDITTLKSIFSDLSDYILIPHYDKKPALKIEYIKELSEYITAGEVTSIKKFIYHSKDDNSLVPVLFSDSRLTENTQNLPIRQTYVDLPNITFSGIKSCLTDKHKVVLSEDNGNKFFQATSDGLTLSTGLNVILGERSSGKSFTLEKIHLENENVKYLKQFSLLQDDEENFNNQLKKEESLVTESYLKEFKEVIEEVVDINIEDNERSIDNYLTSLLENASETEAEDIYSKSTLYNESRYSINNLVSLEKLIEATELLIENTEYKDIIDSHISKDNLKALLIDLINKLRYEKELSLKQTWVNELVDVTKKALQTRSAKTKIEDIDFYKIVSDNHKINKFTSVVDILKNEKQIHSKDLGKFKIVAEVEKYQNATGLKKQSSRQWSFSSAFNQYALPYRFLTELKKIENLQKVDYYKYFINIRYKILNRHGYEVSGGERSEFNLLNEIEDAMKHDMLLIDEPESSFDNQFLKSEVNKLIKELSKEIPIVLVTHNNTVGASIKPDYILYTKRDVADEESPYKVFSGYPSAKELKSNTGETLDNFTIFMNCLEAGTDAYDERKNSIYEILKN